MVTPAQPNRRFLGPGDSLGKFEVIRQIAVGGMAELYLARTVGMEGFEKLVCVKRILPQYVGNPSFVNMFLAEARLAATLHHPNIAQVYDIGQEQGEFFFAMEYVHGEDLGRLVMTARENGVPISLDCALTLVSGLCAGLHHAHEKASPEGKPLGVVHRDVSPTNVLVSYDGAIKLVDFGIARAGGEPSTSTNGLKGKISYMSPEQCRGNVALDRRSDVFSIGTILYELTTGRLPFTDETEYGVLQQIVNRDAAPPSAVAPGYPPALEAIVMRALSRDVNRRFSTALELQNQLEDYAHDNRLRVSPLVLARLMSTLFPARLEEWDHARAQGAFFVEQHVVRTLIESGKSPDGPRFVPQPLPPPTDELGGDSPSHGSANGAPAGRGADPVDPTQVGVAPPTPQPRMPTPHPVAPPRMTTPHPVVQPRMPGPGPGPMQGSQRMPTPPPVAPPGSQPRITPPPMAAAPGSQPRMTPPPMAAAPGSQPRMTPPPMAAAPGSQPRLPTPPPLPGVAPLPGVRYAPMPVPNMPGAVPIVSPMTAPPIASAGTLVSSAVQAGSSQPMPAVSPLLPGMPMAPGMSGGPGMSGMPGMPGMPGTNAPPGPGPYVPAAAGDFSAVDPSRNMSGAPGYGAYGAPGGVAGAARVSGGYPAQMLSIGGAPATAPSQASSARPTLMMRAPRRSWLPIVAVAAAGIAGAIAVFVVLHKSDDTASAPPAAEPAAVRSPAAPAEPSRPDVAAPAAAGQEAPRAGEAPAAGQAPRVAEPAAAGQAPTAGEAAAAGQAPNAGEAATAGQAPTTGEAKVAGQTPAAGEAVGAAGAAPPGGEPVGQARPSTSGATAARPQAPVSDADAAKKRTVKGAATDPRKPARPRPRRASRPETKEQSWNDDSPFMPVQTPKK